MEEEGRGESVVSRRAEGRTAVCSGLDSGGTRVLYSRSSILQRETVCSGRVV